MLVALGPCSEGRHCKNCMQQSSEHLSPPRLIKDRSVCMVLGKQSVPVDSITRNPRSRPQTESSWNKEEEMVWQPRGSPPPPGHRASPLGWRILLCSTRLTSMASEGRESEQQRLTETKGSIQKQHILGLFGFRFVFFFFLLFFLFHLLFLEWAKGEKKENQDHTSPLQELREPCGHEPYHNPQKRPASHTSPSLCSSESSASSALGPPRQQWGQTCWAPPRFLFVRQKYLPHLIPYSNVPHPLSFTELLPTRVMSLLSQRLWPYSLSMLLHTYWFPSFFLSVSDIFLTNSLRRSESHGHIFCFLGCTVTPRGIRHMLRTHKIRVDGMIPLLTAVVRVGTWAYTSTV